MALTLYTHPFAAYGWKVLIALYENGTPFSYRMIDDAEGWAEVASLWPMRKIPLLRDGDATIVESSIIVEYLVDRHPGATPLIPADREEGLKVRFMDRFFDNYVMTPMQKLVSDRIRPDGERDPKGVADAKELLDVAYGWLDNELSHRGWAGGGTFSLADCSAAPALFYADWVHPIDDEFAYLRAYRRRVLARPPVARVVDDARPYRHLFPQGAPDRD